MLAILRVLFLLFYFLLINSILLVVCIIKPFHRNNVFIGGKLYSSMARFVGLKLDVRIPDSVKQGGPFVFIANHQNNYDLMTICAAAQPGMVTVGKKSLKWIPVFGLMYWLTGNIMIDRKNSGKAHGTLKTTADKIKEKRLSVWFFPEGTRSYGRGLLPFKTGAFRIARETQEPIVSVCASTTHNKVKLNRWNNGTVIIELSDPISMDDSKDIKEWSDFFHHKMKGQLINLDLQVAELEK